MALVNWVYGANWTGRKAFDGYLIKDGVIQSSITFVKTNDTVTFVESTSYPGNQEISMAVANATNGIYANVDFTNYDTLTIKGFKVSATPTAICGYKEKDLADPGVYSNFTDSEATYTFDISSLTGEHAVHLRMHDTVATRIYMYVSQCYLS